MKSKAEAKILGDEEAHPLSCSTEAKLQGEQVSHGGEMPTKPQDQAEGASPSLL